MKRQVALVIGLLLGFAIGGGAVVVASTHLNNSGAVNPPVTLAAPSGPALTLETSGDVNLTDPFQSGQVTVNASFGNLTAESAGRTNLSLASITGEWTNITRVNTSGRNLTINPENKTRIIVNSDNSSLDLNRDVAADDQTIDFRYGGPGTASLNLTLVRELSANTNYSAVDADSFTVLGTDKSDSNGNVTFTDLSQSSHNVVLVSQSGSAPVFNDTSASPNNTEIDSKTVDLSVQVNDSNFPFDQLDVTFYHNPPDGNDTFSAVGTDTLDSNGTANTSLTTAYIGNHSWYAVANDSYGLSTQSSTYNFTTRTNLSIFDGSNNSLINRTVNLTFFWDDRGLVNETQSVNGKIPMTQLPASDPFVVAAEIDGYYTRRIYLKGIYQESRIYLLPTNESAVQPTFILRDFSGKYPPDDTVLRIQRPINETWRTVEGDFFGEPNEMTAQLAFNVRHRLFILNTETGESRRFDALYSATTGDKIITVTTRGGLRLAQTGVTVGLSPPGERVTAVNTTFSADFEAITTEFDRYALRVRLNDSGRINYVANKSGTKSGGETLAVLANLTANASERVEVNATYVTAEGDVRTVWRNYTVGAVYSQSGLLDLLALVPSRLSTGSGAVTTFLAFFVSFSLAIAAHRELLLSTEATGLVLVAGLAGFFLFNWLAVEIVFVAGMGWTVAAGIRRGL